MREVDFLIVGQGLAGTVLAHQLISYDYTIAVVGAEKDTASFAAAGIINPVTGRKFVKSWMIDELIPIAIETYKSIEAILNTPLLYSQNIVRCLNSIKEENDWNSRAIDPDYQNYISQSHDDKMLRSLMKPNVSSFGTTTQCYRVDLTKMILTYRDLFKQMRVYYNDHFELENCKKVVDKFYYQDLEIKNIVFCEGARAVQNDLSKDLYFKLAKGNSFIIKTDVELDESIKDDIIICPLGNHQYWIGADYEWDTLDPTVDLTKQNELEQKLKAMISFDYEVIGRSAGIRPTTNTRRPIATRHPDYKNIFFFNGMGTKGTSLAPYFSKLFVEKIIKGEKIDGDLKVNFGSHLKG